ncbi:MAG: sigma-54-dependent Fis family transcriptional regulator [Magnetococcales bacterium]|nr:sigma-54-dependent Fis family transcriptional regulator [Magnetococcales bacterium]
MDETPKGRLLVVDDEKIAVENLEYILKRDGHEVTAVTSGASALKLLQEREFDVVLTDLRMEKVDGMGLLECCRERHPDTEVILVTGFATLESAVEAMKRGAFHYIAKPFRLDEVRKLTGQALEKIRLKRENRHLREEIARYQGEERIVTQDGGMLKLLEFTRQVAPTDCNCLIVGESGVGKEMFARELHARSGRTGPFVGVNCGAFQESLLENELFGHARGAFTGAGSDRKGVIEAARGGTLFLDEITEMSPAMQVKFLRVIQEREVRRLGDTTAIAVDLRFVGATNRNLQEEVAQGRFRKDLFFRLNVAQLAIPPLAERKGDIPLLAHHFLRQFAQRFGKEVVDIDPEVMAVLSGYGYPGNVRELRNIIERGVVVSTGQTLQMAHLPDDLREMEIMTIRRSEGRLPTLDEREREYVQWVFRNEAHGNQTLAAQILGIDRVSLWRKLKKYSAVESTEEP